MIRIKKAVCSAVAGMAIGIFASIACDLMSCRRNSKNKVARLMCAVEDIVCAARRALR